MRSALVAEYAPHRVHNTSGNGPTAPIVMANPCGFCTILANATLCLGRLSGLAGRHVKLADTAKDVVHHHLPL